MIIKTSDLNSIKPILSKLNLSLPDSHKGQNGRVLIIGGSSLFHAASIWAAEVTSHFVDIVHYSSTQENNEIMKSLKKKFLNGIVIPQEQLDNYIKEDDVILVGPGMIRNENKVFSIQYPVSSIIDLIKINNEAQYTYLLTKYLIEKFPEKKYVFDAGSLQMMDCQWLLKLKTPAIITPHQIEFEKLFNIPILKENSVENKAKIVEKTAKQYHCIILLKAIVDIVSDGDQTTIVEGGNQGLTKGGTGDVLAGLVASFYSRNSGFISSVIASYLLKFTADRLSEKLKYWYNIDDIIKNIPISFKNILDRV